MKKILILSIVSLSAITMQAQIKFGVKAGANFSKFGGSDAKLGDVSPKYKAGFTGGGLVNIPINEMLSVQPEALFSMEGSMYKESGEKLIYNLNYINIPVMVQYNNPSGFYAETGPQAGFLMSAKAKVNGESTDVKDNLKGINFAWAVGLGFKMPNGIGVGARYNIGISNISDNDDDENEKITLGGFHLGVFYTFGGSAK